MARQIDFWTLLRMTQEYVSSHYAAVLTDKAKLSQLKAYVDKYLRDNDFKVEGIVKLKCDNSLMKTIVDRFGEDVETHLLDDKSFMVTAEIAVGPPFFSWVFNYCGKIQIIEPQSVKEEYLNRVKEAYNNI